MQIATDTFRRYNLPSLRFDKMREIIATRESDLSPMSERRGYDGEGFFSADDTRVRQQSYLICAQHQSDRGGPRREVFT